MAKGGAGWPEVVAMVEEDVGLLEMVVVVEGDTDRPQMVVVAEEDAGRQPARTITPGRPASCSAATLTSSSGWSWPRGTPTGRR